MPRLRWADRDDAFPYNINETFDSDGDLIGDNSDSCILIQGTSSKVRIGCPDQDLDGLPEPEDNCPTFFGLSEDGCPDSDGDGVSDTNDIFPLDPSQILDEDFDGLGDNTSGQNPDPYPNDSDNDGVVNPNDDFPYDSTAWSDQDGDGYADQVDAEFRDMFPNEPMLWNDADNDSYSDQAGHNLSDDCPSQAGNSNLGMKGCPDFDNDGIPDLLDFDIDGDGYENSVEFRDNSDSYSITSIPPDFDNDLIPDLDDDDADNDGFPNELEIQRSTDPYDSTDTPFTQAPGVYLSLTNGISFSTSYQENGIELSVLRLRDEISTIAGALISIIFSVLTLRRKTRRYKILKLQLDEADDPKELDSIREEIDTLVERNKIKIEQGLLLRNLFEQKEKANLGFLGMDSVKREHRITKSSEVDYDTEEDAEEISDKILSDHDSTSPNRNAESKADGEGYEWHTDAQETSWYRNEGSNSEWQRFEA